MIVGNHSLATVAWCTSDVICGQADSAQIKRLRQFTTEPLAARWVGDHRALGSCALCECFLVDLEGRRSCVITIQ